MNVIFRCNRHWLIHFRAKFILSFYFYLMLSHSFILSPLHACDFNVEPFIKLSVVGHFHVMQLTGPIYVNSTISMTHEYIQTYTLFTLSFSLSHTLTHIHTHTHTHTHTHRHELSLPLIDIIPSASLWYLYLALVEYLLVWLKSITHLMNAFK